MKKINVKIGFYFFITNILLIFLVGSIFYIFSSKTIIKKDIINAQETVQRKGNYIELYISKLVALINILSLDKNIYSYLSNDLKKDNSKDIIEIINNILKSNPDIKSISLIKKDGDIISSEKNIEVDLSKNMMKQPWYINSLKSSMPVLNPIRKQKNQSKTMDNWVVSLSREVVDKAGKNLGIILFDIKYQTLHKYLKNNENGNFTFIVDKAGKIVYYKKFPLSIEEERFLERLKKEKLGYDEKNNQLKVEYLIKNTNWILYEVTILKELKNLQGYILKLFFISSLISLVITFFINYFILKRITKPIKELENHMSTLSNELKKIQLKGDKTIEIMSLEKHFNILIDKINYLREYEINALYSQINPHFLYNTLDTIIWTAEFEDNKKVIAITKALAQFFNISLSNGKEKITLENEINHVKQYLYIQKQRYEEKLEYDIKYDEKLKDILVPKIILQPLVENSIYHGIRNLAHNGVIKIYTEIYENYFDIIVEDNGVGFENSKNNSSLKVGGIGISNVNKRINFYYGKKYGVLVEKNISIGAKVKIRLPYFWHKKRLL